MYSTEKVPKRHKNNGGGPLSFILAGIESFFSWQNKDGLSGSWFAKGEVILSQARI